MICKYCRFWKWKMETRRGMLGVCSNRKIKTLRGYNRKLKEIAKILNIEGNITSYTARHSFATNLKFAGISTDIISQSLGHSNLNITQAYLKEFENEIVDEAIKKLLQEPIPAY